MTAERIRVAVIFGGRSGEHPVSCISAASVLANLDQQRFAVTAIGVKRDGSWLQVDPAAVPVLDGKKLPELTTGQPVGMLPEPSDGAILALGAGRATIAVDVVFPVLHGPFGEDGTLQGMLELAGVPYVGPGVLASAVAMDKEFTKRLLEQAGLQVGRYVVLRPNVGTLTAGQREYLGLPVFVKPARAGSSLGVSRVDDWTDLDGAIELARRADPKVLIEAATAGREVECGVLEYPDGQLRASPTAEIHLAAEHSFYDFQAKYLEDAATFDIPAHLDEGVEEQVQQVAIRAFNALDAQGLARVDVFVTDDGQVVVNEINTMPGFTPISMYPRMFATGGVSYPELLSVLIDTALARGTGLR